MGGLKVIRFGCWKVFVVLSLLFGYYSGNKTIYKRYNKPHIGEMIWQVRKSWKKVTVVRQKSNGRKKNFTAETDPFHRRN